MLCRRPKGQAVLSGNGKCTDERSTSITKKFREGSPLQARDDGKRSNRRAGLGNL